MDFLSVFQVTSLCVYVFFFVEYIYFMINVKNSIRFYLFIHVRRMTMNGQNQMKKTSI